MSRLSKMFRALFGVKREFLVYVRRDKQAGVYIATSEDIPGLVVEVESLDDLEAELKDVIPSLLEVGDGHLKGRNKSLPIFWNVDTSARSELIA